MTTHEILEKAQSVSRGIQDNYADREYPPRTWPRSARRGFHFSSAS
jgi:hypothetical protein